MGLEKIRRRTHIAGEVTIGAGADAGLSRLGANIIGPKSGDTLGINTGTAAIGTADILIDGGLLLRQLGAGTPCLAYRNSSGTIYALYFDAAGGAVTGTPIT